MTLNRRSLALAGLALLSAGTHALAQNLPRVKFITTQGEVVVELYADKAPKTPSFTG